jgi:hypothetical protein
MSTAAIDNGKIEEQIATASGRKLVMKPELFKLTCFLYK